MVAYCEVDVVNNFKSDTSAYNSVVMTSEIVVMWVHNYYRAPQDGCDVQN